MPGNYYVSVPEEGTYFASDLIADVHYPRFKAGFGVAGSYSDVSESAPMPVTIQPTTSGGGTPFKDLDIDESESEIKASPGRLMSLNLHNLDASNTYYVKVYDGLASGVTVGTTEATWTIPLKAGEKFTWNDPNGMAFATGLCIAAETGVLDDGAPGAVDSANDIVAWGTYK